MRSYYDLHIHSCLSPCSEDEMTPNNIVNMAYLKGLNIISVTDHNSSENVDAVMECAEKINITVIPGMEIETAEEIHVLCYLPDLKSLHSLQKLINDNLPNMQNKPLIFGNQIIMDANDNIIGEKNRLLLTAVKLSIKDIFEIAAGLNGVAVPAHIDRDSYSLISNLGSVPDWLNISTLEVYNKNNKINAGLSKYNIISNSDAHRLGDINERENFFDLDEISIKNIISFLKKKN